jgi:small subunit ribosomal protein S3
MAEERKFVKEAIRNKKIEEFLAKEFARADYSHSEIQRTPLSIRITVYSHKPGLIIGRGGKNIDSMTQILKEKFGLENPQLDVQEVENPEMDAAIVARQIAQLIERGLNYKRIAESTIKRVMEAGAPGIAVRISGKLGGDMGRTEKFSAGYLMSAGEPAETMVDTAYARAQVKLGAIGVQVRIMKEFPKELEIIKRIQEEDLSGNTEEKTVEGNAEVGTTEATV